MSKTLIALLLALPLAAPAAATHYLRVVNAAATPIIAVQASPAGGSGWGELSLARHPLHPGQELGIALDGTRRCRYDLRTVYADGREVLTRGFNVCPRSSRQPATLKVGPEEA